MSVLHGACISTELNDLNLIILARYFDQVLDFQWQFILIHIKSMSTEINIIDYVSFYKIFSEYNSYV